MSSIPAWKQRGVALLRRSTLGNGVLLARTYGRQTGWTASMLGGTPVDGSGRPRPWMALPVIRFLEGVVPTDARVFEWGSGSSTAWWSRIAPDGRVLAVEHDDTWVERSRQGLGANATVEHVPLGPGYPSALAAAGGAWDVVVVDGRDRVACALAAAAYLGDRGVIVWDDATRDRYRDGFAELAAAGWARVDFHGPKPLSWSEHATAILYRRGANVLGL